LRWLLFSDAAWAQRLGARYRDAALFTLDPQEHCKLSCLFTPEEERWSPGRPHPELGWVKGDIDPATLRHEHEDRLAGRSPLLLYGSSFAAGTASPVGFAELLEASPDRERWCVLNYAVTAYGLDQSLLLMERTLERFVERDPVAVLAFVVESDMDRATMPFYFAPKPRFEWRDGGFALVPPAELDVGHFLEDHPPLIRSYLLRYFVHGLQVVSTETQWRLSGEVERAPLRRLVSGFLLKAWQSDMERLGVRHFLLLLHIQEALGPGAARHGDEAVLLDFLKGARIPYVDSRSEVERAFERGTRLEELFVQGGKSHGHPNSLGTELLFQALMRGLAGRFDDADSAETPARH
jgi:hypothetical protein